MNRLRLPVLGLLFLAFAATPTVAGAPQSAKALIKQFYALSDICQGDDPSKPSVAKACADRDEVEKRLEAQGYCYGEGAQAGYLAKWLPCRHHSSPRTR